MWSPIFAYFNFYFYLLVVKHPVDRAWTSHYNHYNINWLLIVNFSLIYVVAQIPRSVIEASRSNAPKDLSLFELNRMLFKRNGNYNYFQYYFKIAEFWVFKCLSLNFGHPDNPLPHSPSHSRPPPTHPYLSSNALNSNLSAPQCTPQKPYWIIVLAEMLSFTNKIKGYFFTLYSYCW